MYLLSYNITFFQDNIKKLRLYFNKIILLFNSENKALQEVRTCNNKLYPLCFQFSKFKKKVLSTPDF